MRARNLEAQKKPLATQTIVVAAKPLRFGNELGQMSLRELPWPADALPAGAFSKIADLTAGRGDAVAGAAQGRRADPGQHAPHHVERSAEGQQRG